MFYQRVLHSRLSWLCALNCTVNTLSDFRRGVLPWLDVGGQDPFRFSRVANLVKLTTKLLPLPHGNQRRRERDVVSKHDHLMRLSQLGNARGYFLESAVIQTRHRVVEDYRRLDTAHTALGQEVSERKHLLLALGQNLRRPVARHNLAPFSFAAAALELQGHRWCAKGFAFLCEETLKVLVDKVLRLPAWTARLADERRCWRFASKAARVALSALRSPHTPWRLQDAF